MMLNYRHLNLLVDRGNIRLIKHTITYHASIVVAP